MTQTLVTRRGALAAGITVVGSAFALTGCSQEGGTIALALSAATSKPRAARGFAHPGLLHSAGDLARMRTRVRERAEPWLAGWERLAANGHSASTWKPRPQAKVR